VIDSEQLFHKEIHNLLLKTATLRW